MVGDVDSVSSDIRKGDCKIGFVQGNGASFGVTFRGLNPKSREVIKSLLPEAFLILKPERLGIIIIGIPLLSLGDLGDFTRQKSC